MTCRDCIHYELCFDDNITEFDNGGAEECTYFKDKYIGLPCGVGERVFQICEEYTECKEYGERCEGCVIKHSKKEKYIHSSKVLGFSIDNRGLHIITDKSIIDSEQIGKILFVGEKAKEAAEQALRESENK